MAGNPILLGAARTTYGSRSVTDPHGLGFKHPHSPHHSQKCERRHKTAHSTRVAHATCTRDLPWRERASML